MTDPSARMLVYVLTATPPFYAALLGWWLL